MKPPWPRSVHRKLRLPAIETLVAEALVYLGEDPERIARFLASSGLDVSDLRRVASGPAFAESLLDHVCQDEMLLVAFAESRNYDPADIERLRQSLTPPPPDG